MTKRGEWIHFLWGLFLLCGAERSFALPVRLKPFVGTTASSSPFLHVQKLQHGFTDETSPEKHHALAQILCSAILERHDETLPFKVATVVGIKGFYLPQIDGVKDRYLLQEVIDIGVQERLYRYHEVASSVSYVRFLRSRGEALLFLPSLFASNLSGFDGVILKQDHRDQSLTQKVNFSLKTFRTRPEVQGFDIMFGQIEDGVKKAVKYSYIEQWLADHGLLKPQEDGSHQVRDLTRREPEVLRKYHEFYTTLHHTFQLGSATNPNVRPTRVVLDVADKNIFKSNSATEDFQKLIEKIQILLQSYSTVIDGVDILISHERRVVRVKAQGQPQVFRY